MPPTNLAASPPSGSETKLRTKDDSSNETKFKMCRRQKGTAGWVCITEARADVTACGDAGRGRLRSLDVQIQNPIVHECERASTAPSARTVQLKVSR